VRSSRDAGATANAEPRAAHTGPGGGRRYRAARPGGARGAAARRCARGAAARRPVAARLAAPRTRPRPGRPRRTASPMSAGARTTNPYEPRSPWHSRASRPCVHDDAQCVRGGAWVGWRHRSRPWPEAVPSPRRTSNVTEHTAARIRSSILAHSSDPVQVHPIVDILLARHLFATPPSSKLPVLEHVVVPSVAHQSMAFTVDGFHS